MKIKIKKLSNNAVTPKYAKPGDAGMDLTITSLEYYGTEKVKFGFGIAMEIPEGFVGLVFPRSSVHKTGMRLTNCVGVIDSGYRGEIQAVFDYTHGDSYQIGDRAAQIIIMPYPSVEFEEVEELSGTARGSGGFGSSGK